jgi:hypothetical protein
MEDDAMRIAHLISLDLAREAQERRQLLDHRLAGAEDHVDTATIVFDRDGGSTADLHLLHAVAQLLEAVHELVHQLRATNSL